MCPFSVDIASTWWSSSGFRDRFGGNPGSRKISLRSVRGGPLNGSFSSYLGDTWGTDSVSQR